MSIQTGSRVVGSSILVSMLIASLVAGCAGQASSATTSEPVLGHPADESYESASSSGGEPELVDDAEPDFPGSCGDAQLLTAPDTTVYETPWNATPANSMGGVLPYSEWPARLLEHPATAQVDTDTGAMIEAYDRTGCLDLSLDPLPIDPAWSPDSIAIVDLSTNETIDTFPKDHTFPEEDS